MKKQNDNFSFYKLEWDTDYFGISCAKLILHEPIKMKDWESIQDSLLDYQFISIVNEKCNPTNSKIISSETPAFIIDTNIQFVKKTNKIKKINSHVSIAKALEWNEEIINMANFNNSKFIDDNKLASRGGEHVYSEWVKNAFNNPDKYFATYTDSSNILLGFALFSFNEESCVIELIAVSSERKRSGIGVALFEATEHKAHLLGYSQIKVGTQIRNVNAINFYNKVGCKQIEAHQIYHLWNS